MGVALDYSSGSSDDLEPHARPEAYLAELTATPADWVTVIGTSLHDDHGWGIYSCLTRK